MSVFKQRKSWRAKVVYKGKVIADKAGFSRKREALEWHDKFKVDFKAGRIQLESKNSYCFEELIARFHDSHLNQLKLGSKRRYLIDIDLRIKPFFAFRKLNELQPYQFEEFRVQLQQSGLSKKSINNCMGTLSSMLRKAVEWGMIKDNPCRIRPLKIDKNKSYLWWDDPNDISLFLDLAKTACPRYFPAFLLALETGMRLGEIVSLVKKDIDFKRGRILIWRQWLDKEKEYGSPKNGLKRYVYFDPKGELHSLLESRTRNLLDSSTIFVTRNGKRVLPRNLSGQIFKRLVRKAGVPDVPFHGLRHTFASWYMIEHDDIYALKALLGHSDIKTTQKYAHLSERHKRKPLVVTKLLQKNESSKFIE